jgi:hypothetical protein
MYYFRINQFVIESQLMFPCEPIEVDTIVDGNSVDVTILDGRGTLTDFPYVSPIGRYFGGAIRSYDVADRILICAEDNIRFTVSKDGKLIVYDVQSQQRQQAALYIANLGLSLCTLLHENISLHAAGVDLDGHLVGLMASSGTGKSTLLWFLLDHGARFSNDDILAINVTGNQVFGMPSVSWNPKLSREEVEKRFVDIAGFQEVLPSLDEYWIPVRAEQRLLAAKRLDAVFLLKPLSATESHHEVFVQRQHGSNAMSLVIENIRGLWAVHELLDKRWLFQQCAELVRYLPVYTLEYPKRMDILTDVQIAIQAALNNL